MILSKRYSGETHYEVLSARENATQEEIRASYRSAVLNSHPDKLRRPDSFCENGSDDRFVTVQRAWEVLGDPDSRALYDHRLRAIRREDMAASEDLGLEDMGVEDAGDWVELCYQCRCGDCFSIDSLELEKMGYVLSRSKNENMVSFQTVDAFPASVVLPCGSCSLKVKLLIDPTVYVSIGG